MSVCIALSLPIMAQRKVKTKVNAPATWAESIAAAKKQANSEMQRTCLPVVSQVIKSENCSSSFYCRCDRIGGNGTIYLGYCRWYQR